MKVELYNEFIKEAIDGANNVVNDCVKKQVHLENVHALENALKAYKQRFPKSKADYYDILWLDTLAYNLPTGLIEYIKHIYNGGEASKSANDELDEWYKENVLRSK